MNIAWLLALFLGIMLLHVLGSTEGFAATSTGTLMQLMSSRPVVTTAWM